MEVYLEAMGNGIISCFDKLETMVQAGFQAGFTDPYEYNRECDVQLADYL
jgi:hypothetical protein